jgi:2-polyprenyl-3-methyl-5-hydroxy-6-metoxy-1,4-benzoquinol methylase
VVASGQDYEYETTADVFQVKRCAGCGHHFVSPRPATEDLGTIYPGDYYAYRFIENLSPLARGTKAFLDRRKVRSWLAEAKVPAPRFLDVGCGDGWFLRLLHAEGISKDRLWGVEIDRGAIDRLRADGFQGRVGTIEAADLPASSFDLVVMLQVIEHVSDPAAVLAKLRSLLAPDGVLILETPNLRSLDFNLFRAGLWGGYHFPRHWNLFTEDSLARLLAGAGLRLVKTAYLPAPTFWVYSIHHLVKYRWGFRRAARFLDPLRNLPAVGAATAFDLLRARLGFRTSNMRAVIRRS